MKTWDGIWKEYRLNFLGHMVERAQAKMLARIADMIKLPKDAKTIDIGCGSGFTLSCFRKLGYSNSVGIDASPNSLEVCSRLFGFAKERDVFLMNAANIKFPDNHFDLVFSAGMLEHFKEPPLDIVGEFCRISRKWILLFQPDQTSLFGRVKWLWQELGRASWEKEYHYSKQDYINMLASLRFNLVASGSLNFQELMWLLFSEES